MTSINENFSLKEYMEKVVADVDNSYEELIRWSEDQKKNFAVLVNDLKTQGATTKVTGDKLERIVKFIINNSFFFEIYTNVHTETNEIDEVIRLSDRGKIALHTLNIPRDLIPIGADLFLGECKNYASRLNVTYVGKFYSLLTITGIPFGIIFTRVGLTGDTEGFEDANGLTKVLRMMEQAKNPSGDFCILTFAKEDYEKMINGVSFFELIKAKKLELQLASNYNNFIRDNKHSAEDDLKEIIGSLSN